MATLVDDLIAAVEIQHRALVALDEWARFVNDRPPSVPYQGSDIQSLVREALHTTVDGVSVATRPLPRG